MPVASILADGTEKLRKRAAKGGEKTRAQRKGRKKQKMDDGYSFMYEPEKPSIKGARVVQGWRSRGATYSDFE